MLRWREESKPVTCKALRGDGTDIMTIAVSCYVAIHVALFSSYVWEAWGHPTHMNPVEPP